MGAALLQPGPDRAFQPVAYAFRVVNNAEKNNLKSNASH